MRHFAPDIRSQTRWIGVNQRITIGVSIAVEGSRDTHLGQNRIGGNESLQIGGVMAGVHVNETIGSGGKTLPAAIAEETRPLARLSDQLAEGLVLPRGQDVTLLVQNEGGIPCRIVMIQSQPASLGVIGKDSIRSVDIVYFFSPWVFG